MKYTWTDASALWQIEHGELNTERYNSAVEYLEDRLRDSTNLDEIMNGLSAITYRLIDSVKKENNDPTGDSRTAAE